MIGPCTCKHPSQDALHGPGMRVFNERTGNKAPRCTVCGANAKGNYETVKPGKK